MIAVHKLDARERQSALATDTQEALPWLNALADHAARQPAVAHRQACRALVPDAAPWEEAHAAEIPAEDDSASAMAGNAADPGTDRMLSQYCAEVRRFALLSVVEEQALGRQIARWQRRIRWALYTSPLAWPKRESLPQPPHGARGVDCAVALWAGRA
jgi:hypothetical protein